MSNGLLLRYIVCGWLALYEESGFRPILIESMSRLKRSVKQAQLASLSEVRKLTKKILGSANPGEEALNLHFQVRRSRVQALGPTCDLEDSLGSPAGRSFDRTNLI